MGDRTARWPSLIMVWKLSGTTFDGTWKTSRNPKFCPAHTGWDPVKIRNGSITDANNSAKLYAINPMAAWDQENWRNTGPEKWVWVVNNAHDRVYAFGTGRGLCGEFTKSGA